MMDPSVFLKTCKEMEEISERRFLDR